MYLHPGIVILKFILSHRVLFLLVSSAIDVATAVGWCPIECPYVQWLQQMEHTHRGCVKTPYVQWLQQMEHTHRGCVETCMLGKTPSTP